MNRVLLTGRFSKNPEIKVTQGNNPMTIARFTLAVKRRGKNDEVDWIPCIAFGKTAEFIDKYFKQGMKADIEGRWQTGSYENKSGQKVYTNDCIVDLIEFGESKKETEEKNDKTDQWMNIPDSIETELPFN